MPCPGPGTQGGGRMASGGLLATEARALPGSPPFRPFFSGGLAPALGNTGPVSFAAARSAGESAVARVDVGSTASKAVLLSLRASPVPGQHTCSGSYASSSAFDISQCISQRHLEGSTLLCTWQCRPLPAAQSLNPGSGAGARAHPVSVQ